MTTYIKDGGVWKPASVYVKDAGVWKLSTAYVKDAGVWKLASNPDVTPPATPTVTASVINGKYFNVGVKVGTANVADLSTVRVLVSTTAQPGSWTSSGLVNDVDQDYPGEIWSDWEYNTDVRPDSSVFTYKAYPANADDSVQLQAGTYYISAFAKDTAGNISAAGTATAVIPYVGTVTPPTTQLSYTSDFTATWSKSWYGNASGTANDNDVFSNGEKLRVGFWPQSGRMISALGFNSTDIMRHLKGATITKVQVRLHSREMYYNSGNVRWRYHARTTAPSTWNYTWDFGPTRDYTNWPDWTAKWIDITADSPTQWKTGAKTGLYLLPADDSLHSAICMTGHLLASPPVIRFTYLK